MVSALAELCGAKLILGGADVAIDSAANIDEATATQLSFIASAKHRAKLGRTAAGALIVPDGLALDEARQGLCVLVAEDPEMAFIRCLERLYPARPKPATVSHKALIDPTASIGENTHVSGFVTVGARSRVGAYGTLHAGCSIGEDVRIGDRCVLHPNVVIYDGVILGDDVVIHAGTVIGADGYGYKFRNGEHVKFPQVGTVVIESNVEIGANTCIDRASLGATRISRGAKIDNQVHVAHNVQVGRCALLLGQVGIGGSTKIGDYAILASQSGVSDHVTVGDQAVVMAQGGVTKDVEPGEQVMGFPATNRKAYLRENAALRRIAQHQKAIERLVRLLPELQAGATDENE
jgi:UDP-3-O-[3-hydroxymyristoyl] glucosamine N-acyltransferase